MPDEAPVVAVGNKVSTTDDIITVAQGAWIDVVGVGWPLIV